MPKSSYFSKQSIAIFVTIILSIIHNILTDNFLTCRDEKGSSIDWSVIYKLPKLEHHSNTIIKDGFGSVFVTSTNNDQWSISYDSMNSSDSIIGRTLSQIFNKKLDLLIAYNDQPPVGDVSFSLAHAKGVIAISGNSGFYLMHSVPRFPDLDKEIYYYPSSGKHNGQNIICITLSTNDKQTLNTVANHLLTMRPSLYEFKIEQTFSLKFPLFNDIKRKKWSKKNSSHVNFINSAQRTTFTMFVKNSKFNRDIYSDLIAPYVKHDIAVQTWRNGGGGKLSADCIDDFKVMNIEEIRVDNESDWKYTEDHSKWAISTTNDNKLWCIADINRMHSQFKRGGGAICLRSDAMWKRYYNIAKGIDACPKS